MFPIGHMPKSQVRDEAARFKLPTAKRKDSQGICFLGKINFDDFLRHHLGEKPGDIVEFETEKKIGTHNGFWFHTIGQRKGLGLSGGPWYVVDKDPQKNIVFISSDYHSVDKKRRDFAVADMNWIGRLPKDLSGITVKLRHGPQSHGCSIEILETGDVKVELDSDDHGIAPGQFAVFYQGDRCLGGGAIKSPSC
jgi:tRNA-5-taurinomethyluridine 2-sulfurtransferase